MEQQVPKRIPLWGSQRLILVIFAFFGTLLLMIMRFNFSMAIVCMTSNKTEDNNTNITSAEFQWDKTVQGYCLSAFFYGYVINNCEIDDDDDIF